MSLKSIPLIGTYRTSDNDLLSEFYIPCLANSIKYDRAVGYFNSSILNYISNGLYQFILNNGKMRLVCGVELSNQDFQAIKEGYSYRKIIEQNLNKQVDLLLENHDQANIKNLCWLIKTGNLDIKIAIRKLDDLNIDINNINIIYHEKFGIFTDSLGNKVVFAGSLNESANGWIYNFESFDVFWSWQKEFVDRVQDRVDYFERLWANITPNVQVYEFPKAVKEKLIEVAPSEPIDKVYPLKVLIRNEKKKKIIPRDYQLQAVKKWKENNYKGLFEMATGTGKTITAILCAEEFIKDHCSTLVIIVCPYQHLVDQWRRELNKLGL